MSKSMDFITAKTKTEKNQLFEIPFYNIIDKKYFHNNKYVYHVKEHKDSKEIVTISLEYNPNIKYDYYDYDTCVCDGTLWFAYETCGRLFSDLATPFNTFDTKKLPKDLLKNKFGYDAWYQFGDFIVEETFDETTSNKTYMHTKFTAMLPIKMGFIRNDY